MTYVLTELLPVFATAACKLHRTSLIGHPVRFVHTARHTQRTCDASRACDPASRNDDIWFADWCCVAGWRCMHCCGPIARSHAKCGVSVWCHSALLSCHDSCGLALLCAVASMSWHTPNAERQARAQSQAQSGESARSLRPVPDMKTIHANTHTST